MGFTLQRIGYCFGDLPQLKDYNLNETEFLRHEMKVFLDEANFDNEQLTNVTALMDQICRDNERADEIRYPISANLDVNKYSNASGKVNRCRAISEVLDAMYPVFKRASLNKSEPLDFSVIQFYNATDKLHSYNVSDLINTIWIKSETPLDLVCEITDSVKSYVKYRTSNSTAQDRSQLNKSALQTLLDFIDRLLDPILGIQKRLYWESSTRYEQAYLGLANQLSSLRDGFGKRYSSTRKHLANMFFASTNSTSATNLTFTNNTNLPVLRLDMLNKTSSLLNNSVVVSN